MMHEALREADWQRLEELRAQFLAAQEGDASAQPSAWKNERDLLLYDAVYGARIGWKWDAFLRDALPRLVLPANARLLDLGCGTGVATRAFARHAAGAAASVQLVDHSLVATQVANSLVERDVPGLARTATPCDLQSLVAQPFDVLLVSHVIDEWKDEAWHAALRLARQASVVLWLEGGARATSRAMQRVREDLLTDFEPLLPCTHSASCGALQELNTHEWCHRFAQPPQEAFTTAHFSFAAKRLGLDLRSLPYCGLAMAKPGFYHPRTSGLVRVLGRGKSEKGKATASICDVHGVRRVQILERYGKSTVRALADAPWEVDLLKLGFAGEQGQGKVVSIEPV